MKLNELIRPPGSMFSKTKIDLLLKVAGEIALCVRIVELQYFRCQ